MGLFKRKAGGTPLGNTFRGIFKKVTGGVLGNGLLLKKTPDAINMPAPDISIPVSQEKILNESITHGVNTAVDNFVTQNKASQPKNDTINKVGNFVQNNKITAIAIGMAGLIIALILVKRKK